MEDAQQLQMDLWPEVTLREVLSVAYNLLPEEFPLPNSILISQVNPRQWVVNCEVLNDDQPYIYGFELD